MLLCSHMHCGMELLMVNQKASGALACTLAGSLVVYGHATLAANGADQVTGCLTRGGTIVRLALGNEPAKPCPQRSVEMSWPLAGADGAPVTGAEMVPFYVTLDGDGTEAMLTINGPLEVFARCELGEPDPNNPGRSVDIVSVIATSSEDGWFTNRGNGPRLAGEEDTLLSSGDNLLAGEEGYVAPGIANNLGSAVAPDGSYIGVAADIIGFGANIFGHDCIVVGAATMINGDP